MMLWQLVGEDVNEFQKELESGSDLMVTPKTPAKRKLHLAGVFFDY